MASWSWKDVQKTSNAVPPPPKASAIRIALTPGDLAQLDAIAAEAGTSRSETARSRLVAVLDDDRAMHGDRP